MVNKESNFGSKAIIIIAVIIIIAGIIFSLASFLFNKSFFLKYSPDNSLKEETLKKIEVLRISIALFGLICFSLVLLTMKLRVNFISFLNYHKLIIINMTLLLFAIVIFLLIGEVALRIAIYDETSGHGASPGSLKFNEKYVALNREGFRDFEYPVAKPANTVRIAVIGDSFTFGMGVKNVSDTYPKALERDLNSLNLSKTFQVLAFGVPGYDTSEHLKTIKEHALKYSPDIIVIGYVLNDLPNPDKIDIKYQRVELPFIGFWLRSSSYLYYFLESRLNEILRSRSKEYNYESILGRLYNSSANINASKEIYKEIAKEAEANNAKVIILTFPIIYKLDNYSFMQAHEHAKEIALDNGFLHDDLLKEYQKHKVEELVVNKYDAHPNELGQKIAANALLKLLIENNLV